MSVKVETEIKNILNQRFSTWGRVPPGAVCLYSRVARASDENLRVYFIFGMWNHFCCSQKIRSPGKIIFYLFIQKSFDVFTVFF